MNLRMSLKNAIDDLKNDCKAMADLVLTNITDAFVAFKDNNQELASDVIQRDEEVDQKEELIAKKALRIIWKEQPVAHDLRVVTGILKLISDLERIGDHSVDISELTQTINHIEDKRLLPNTSKMTKLAREMVNNAIDAFVRQDQKLAEDIIKSDDLVDELFKEILSSITNDLKEDLIQSEYAVAVIMVAKYVERVADHAVNLAEWIIFMITGDHKLTPLF